MPSISVIRFTRQELQSIDKAIEHLDKTFATKINAYDLAETYKIPLKKLQAGVVKRTGLTVKGYIEAARIAKAMELLADDTPLKSIANRIGFKNASNFGRFFRSYTGQTPTEYRYRLGDT